MNEKPANTAHQTLEYTSKTQPPPRPKPAPLQPGIRQRLWVMLFLVIVIQWFQIHLLGKRDLNSRLVLHWLAYLTFGTVSLISVLSILYIGIFLLTKRRIFLGLLALFACVGCICLSGVEILFVRSISYRVQDQLTTPDGKTYCTLSRSNGEQILIAGNKQSGLFFDSYESLKVSDPPTYIGRIVRPEPAPTFIEFKLYSTPKGWIFTVQGGSIIFYNPHHPDPLAPVDPYILFDDQTPIHHPDEQRFTKGVFGDILSEKNFPRYYNLLKADLNHPNPNVSESAKRVLDFVNRNLGLDSNSNIQEAATRYLDGFRIPETQPASP